MLIGTRYIIFIEASKHVVSSPTTLSAVES